MSNETNPMREAIKSAIDENPVILFMKGTPEQPACGFSARTVASGRAGAAVALRFSEGTLWALDQTLLPFEAVEVSLHSAAEVAEAIRRLAIRGAPLIGVGAGYGVALELLRDPSPAALER